jgi:hypothetical protein
MSSEQEQEGLGKPEAVQTIPWEDPARGLVGRFLGTLGNALRPVRGTPQLCGIRVAPAFRFALLSALPAMLLWGIVPFTSTLLFKGGLQVEVRPDKLPIWLDVLRAMSLSFCVSFLGQLVWALPFASLLRAFAAEPMPAPLVTATAYRFVFYRAWLVPACNLTLWTLSCILPAAQSGALGSFEAILQLVPQVMILLGAQAMALTFGASMLGSLAVALVPLVLEAVVMLIANEYAVRFLPHLLNMPAP